MILETRPVAFVVAACMVLWFAASVSAASASAEVAGCVTDIAGQPIPGVKVVAKAWGVQQTAFAGASGCYELIGLPPNLYRITARLPGFDNTTRENIRVLPENRLRLDFQLQVSAMCDCLVFPQTLEALWDHSGAVLHLRLTDHGSELPAPRGYFKHTAEVLDGLKSPLDTGAAVTILEEQGNGAPGPYDVGQELVMFLRAWPGDRTSAEGNDPMFVAANVPDSVFVVEDGRIQHAPAALSRYVGATLDDFFTELRTFPAGR